MTDTADLIRQARDPLFGKPDADHAHEGAGCVGCLFTLDARTGLLRALADRLAAQQAVVDAVKAYFDAVDSGYPLVPNLGAVRTALARVEPEPYGCYICGRDHIKERLDIHCKPLARMEEVK